MRSSFLALLLLVFNTAFADQLIVEPEMGREPILHELQAAKHSIHLVMYGFTDEAFLNTLLQQNMAGKKIQILLENHPYRAENENDKTIAVLNAEHIAWQGAIPPFRLIHQKTWVIDERKAIVMTFNLTHSAFKQHFDNKATKKQRNFAIILDDERKVKDIESLFAADWKHIPTHFNSSDIIISPDNSRQSLLNLIAQAKQSLRIYAQTLADEQIINALKNAAIKGVAVQVLCSTPFDKAQQKEMIRAGINLKVSKKMIIHAKVFIVDSKTSLLGSINLTRSSLEDNRELSIITKDPKVLAPLLATFNKDWEIG